MTDTIYDRATYPTRGLWCAIPTVRTVFYLSFTWVCPHCKTENVTKLTKSGRRRSPWKLNAKCGHCHGNIVTLVDKSYRAYANDIQTK